MLIAAFVIFGIIFLIATALVAYLTTIKQNERAIVLWFGEATKVVGPGLVLEIPWVRQLVRYPTAKQEVELKLSVMTLEDTADPDPDKHHSATEAQINVSCRFNYPTDNDLIATFESLGLPENKSHVADILEEPASDVAETVAAGMNWEDLYKKKADFNRRAAACITTMMNARNGIFSEAGLTNISVILTEVKIPDELKEALTGPEIEKAKAKASVHEKEQLMQKAEGHGAEVEQRVSGAVKGVLGDDGPNALAVLISAVANKISKD